MSTHVEKVSKGGKKSLHTIKVPSKPTNSKKKGLRTMVASKDINKCFSGRKDTLFQKALELEVATSATVALSVTRTNGPSFRFKSTHEIIMEPPEAPSVKVNESIEIDTTTQPGTSTSTSSTPLSPRHQPARMSVEIATQTQESFLKEQLTVDPSSCRVCGEDQSDQRRLWVGCSFKNCNFWVHAMCRGIGSKTKSSLSKIKFHCPKHIGSS